MYNDELTASQWALNSAVECHLHTVEVIGSNPIAPTIFSIIYGLWNHSGISALRAILDRASCISSESTSPYIMVVRMSECRINLC